MNYDYRLKYTLIGDAGCFGPADIDLSKGEGLTDAFLFVSMIYPPDGQLSVMFLSHDGRTAPPGRAYKPTPLEDRELLKVWCLLGTKLSHSADLPPSARKVVGSALKAFTGLLKFKGD